MIIIKVLISDFDCTLFRNDKELRRNVKLVNGFMKDNIFILATGRPYSDIISMIRKFKIKYNYLICNDGGMIFDSEDNMIKQNNIDKLVCIKVVDYLVNNKISNYYLDHGFENSKEIDDKVNGIIIKHSDIVISNKILDDIMNVSDKLHGYISKNWINITDINVSKANGIKYLEETFELKREDIYVIGDAINDLTMIKEYNGYGISNCNECLLPIIKRKFNNIEEFIKYIKTKR